jgi:hypothetical protein
MTRDRLRLILERWLNVKQVFKRYKRLWHLKQIQGMLQIVKKFKNAWPR